VTRIRSAIALLAAVLLLGGCGKKGAPADPPTDVAVVAGDARFTVTWTMVPNVEYWLFYAPANEITQDNWDKLPGAGVIRPAASPTILTGLANGTTYSLFIDGRIDSGPAGPGTPSMSVMPRPAGASWTASTSLGSMELRSLALGAVFVAVGSGGEIFSSPDGAVWTTLTSPVTGTALNAALYYGGNYLAAGAAGTMVLSTDAATWTVLGAATGNDLYALATSGSVYVAVGDAGTILRSTDAQTWTTASSSGAVTSQLLYDATYANGLFVTVGAGGTLLTSSDADTWSVAVSNTSSDLRSIAWGANTFVAVGDGGTLVTSADGVIWTAQPQIAGAPDLRSVTYASQFVAVGLGGAVYTSTDGLTWQSQTSGTTEDLLAVAFGNYGYTAVGAAGTNLVSH
jgi:predicted small lipoprotein YifL